MKFITYRHQTREHENGYLMLLFQACHSGWKGNQSLALELLWMSATPTVFHVNQRDGTGNQLEEVGVWRESIAPARRLKLAPVKGNHLITPLETQGSAGKSIAN